MYTHDVLKRVVNACSHAFTSADAQPAQQAVLVRTLNELVRKQPSSNWNDRLFSYVQPVRATCMTARPGPSAHASARRALFEQSEVSHGSALLYEVGVPMHAHMVHTN
jgi:hypothetical protein